MNKIRSIVAGREGFLSQSITSATTFLTSLLIINISNPIELRKWFLYVVSALVFQGFLRSTFLEQRILTSDKKHSRTSFFILLFSLFPVSIIPIVSMHTKSSFGILDSLMIIFAVLSLLQDILRYLLFQSKGSSVILGDSIWLFSATTVLVITYLRPETRLTTVIALLIVGPMLAIVYLVLRLEKVDFNLKVVGLSYINHFQYLVGASSLFFSLLLNFLIAKYLDDDNFRNLRIVQTLASPVQAIMLSFWLHTVLENKDGKNIRSVMQSIRSNFRLLSRYSLPIIAVFGSLFLVSAEIFSYSISFCVLLGIFASVTNSCFYPIGTFMRRKRMFQEMFEVNLLVGFLVSLIFFVRGSELKLIEIQLYLSVSIVLIQILYWFRITYSQSQRNENCEIK